MAAEKRLKRNGCRIFLFGCTCGGFRNLPNEHFFSVKRVSSFSLTSFLKKAPPNIAYDNLGYVTTRRDRISNVNIKDDIRKDYLKIPFLQSDFKHFVQNLKWCKQNNIKVVAYRMVSCHEMDELEDKLSGVDWNKIKQAVLDEGFVWLERPPSPLLEQIEEHCWDGSHLNAEGAELFSNWLGQELAKLDWFKENQQISEIKE